MFDSIRGRFQSVQENLTASFKGLSFQENNEDTDGASATKANFNAGLSLLDHYQKSWEELHGLSQDNVNAAQELDNTIGQIHKKIDKQWKDLGHLSTVVLGIPQVVHNVQLLSDQIDSLGKLFVTIENLLINLEDLVETRQLQEQQLDHRFQLAMYKEKKLAELEAVRVKLVQEHADKLKRHELRQQRLARERQETFDQQFQKDLLEYKDCNQIPAITRRPDNTTNPKLEEVTIDDDAGNSSLKEFLNDVQQDTT